jgi:hypothetical protein
VLDFMAKLEADGLAAKTARNYVGPLSGLFCSPALAGKAACTPVAHAPPVSITNSPWSWNELSR